MPPIVESSTNRSTTLRNGAGLSAILTSEAAPRRPSSWNRYARTRLVRVIETSAAPRTATTAISTITITSWNQSPPVT